MLDKHQLYFFMLLPILGCLTGSDSPSALSISGAHLVKRAISDAVDRILQTIPYSALSVWVERSSQIQHLSVSFKTVFVQSQMLIFIRAEWTLS